MTTRVGLLVDGESVDAWVANALERMLEECDAEITLVVENAAERGLGFYLDAARNDGIWTLQHAVALLGRKLGTHPDYRSQRPLEDVFDPGRVHWTSCHPLPNEGLGDRLPARVVERVADETDVAVRFGFGLVGGAILDAPEHGVLSFHHGDVREYRGRPPGFWEFLHGAETAGITLQRLTDSIDAGEVVAETRVDVADAGTWRGVRERLYANSDALLADGVSTLGRPDATPAEVDELGPLYTRPGPADFLRYVRKDATGWLSRYVSE